MINWESLHISNLIAAKVRARSSPAKIVLYYASLLEAEKMSRIACFISYPVSDCRIRPTPKLETLDAPSTWSVSHSSQGTQLDVMVFWEVRLWSQPWLVLSMLILASIWFRTHSTRWPISTFIQIDLICAGGFKVIDLWVQSLGEPKSTGKVFGWCFSGLGSSAPFWSTESLRLPLLCLRSRRVFALCPVCAEIEQHWPHNQTLIDTCRVVHQTRGCLEWMAQWGSTWLSQTPACTHPSNQTCLPPWAWGRKTSTYLWNELWNAPKQLGNPWGVVTFFLYSGQVF